MKIICQWDMCIYNARCHENTEPICKNKEIKLTGVERDKYLKCDSFKSVLKVKGGQ